VKIPVAPRKDALVRARRLSPRARRLVLALFLGLSALGLVAGLVGVRWVKGQRSVIGFAALDDDNAIILTVSRDDEKSIRLIDGEGTERWSAPALFDVLEPPPLTVFEASGVVTLGDESAHALADGTILWRRPPRVEGDPTRSVWPCEDTLFVRYPGVGVGIDALTGAERFRVPLGRGVRHFPVAGSLVLEETQPETTTAYALFDGAPLTLSGTFCRAGPFLLQVQTDALYLVDPIDWSVVTRAVTSLEVENPRCGVYGETILVADTRTTSLYVVALDRVTLAPRWEQRIAAPDQGVGGCRLGARIPMADALPRILPILAGASTHFVDLESGEIVGRGSTTPGHGCTAGLVAHEGRVYEASSGSVTTFATDAPERAHRIELSILVEEEPSFEAGHVWLHDREHVGRLRLPDLVPAPGGEWLAQ
jgi:hypothetical protein